MAVLLLNVGARKIEDLSGLRPGAAKQINT